MKGGEETLREINDLMLMSEIVGCSSDPFAVLVIPQ
jgi:hypothetical protein